MALLSRLKQKIKPSKPVRDPFGTLHRNITFVLTLEMWDHMKKEDRQRIVEWAKQNLWTDVIAYRILKDIRTGELTV